MSKVRIYTVIAGLLFSLTGLVVLPVTVTGTDANGASVTALGQHPDGAAAAGTLTLYAQSPAPVRRLQALDWYRMDPGTSYFAWGFKPYLGWGATYYDVATGNRYKVECRLNNCPTVYIMPSGVRIVGVYHLY